MVKFGRGLHLAFGILMIFILIACAARGSDSYGLGVWAILLIAAGAAAVLWAARRLYFALAKRFDSGCNVKTAKADRIFFVMVCAMFILQLYFGYKLTLAPITDLGYTDRAARQLCADGDLSRIYETLPVRHDSYFAIYPNNQTLLMLLTALYKIEYALTGEMSRSLPIFVNALALNLSFAYMYKCAKLIYKGSAAKPLFVGICGALFSSFYTYVPFYYTDSLSMPLVMAALYRYLKASDRLRGGGGTGTAVKKALPHLFLCAVYIVMGFEMKGSVIILLPAFMLFTAVDGYDLKRARLVKTLLIFGFAAAVLLLIFIYGKVILSFGIATDAEYERYKFPPHHWIMMGMKTRGGYSFRDFYYTLSFETYAEKQAADVTRMYYRFENFGFGGMVFHFFKKAAYTWADGAYLIFYHIDGGKDSALRSFITDSQVFRFLCSLYHFAVLYAVTGGFFKGYENKNGVGRSWLLRIIFLGVLFFFELWETRSRYLVNYMPVFILLAADFCMDETKVKLVRPEKKQ